jgi:PKD repeat protein
MNTKKHSIALVSTISLILLVGLVSSASAWTFSPEFPTQSITIKQLPVPKASFITDPNDVYHGVYWGGDSKIYFKDTSTSPNPIVSWNWDFGDGYGSTLQNPTHMYPYCVTNNPHEYTITLTVKNKYGFSSTAKALITVYCIT